VDVGRAQVEIEGARFRLAAAGPVIVTAPLTLSTSISAALLVPVEPDEKMTRPGW